MAKAKKRTARNDIYQNGVKIRDEKTKSGFRRDRSKPEDADDVLLVKKGQEYWTWKFRYGGTHISLTPPTRSQLTQSGFLTQLYDIQDQISSFTASTPEEIEEFVSNMRGDLESLQEECQGSLDNMPEGLQESSSSGQTLTERIEMLENAISELDQIEVDYDDPTDEDVKEEIGLEADDEEADVESLMEAKRSELLETWIQEQIDAIQAIGIDA